MREKKVKERKTLEEVWRKRELWREPPEDLSRPRPRTRLQQTGAVSRRRPVSFGFCFARVSQIKRDMLVSMILEYT